MIRRIVFAALLALVLSLALGALRCNSVPVFDPGQSIAAQASEEIRAAQAVVSAVQPLETQAVISRGLSAGGEVARALQSCQTALSRARSDADAAREELADVRNSIPYKLGSYALYTLLAFCLIAGLYFFGPLLLRAVRPV